MQRTIAPSRGNVVVQPDPGARSGAPPRGVVSAFAAFLAVLFLVLAVVPDGRSPLGDLGLGTAFLQSLPDEPAPTVRAAAIAAIDGEEVAGDPWHGDAANSVALPLDAGRSLPRRIVDARAAADRPVPERPPRPFA